MTILTVEIEFKAEDDKHGKYHIKESRQVRPFFMRRYTPVGLALYFGIVLSSASFHFVREPEQAHIQAEQASRPFHVSLDRIRVMALVHEHRYQSDPGDRPGEISISFPAK